MDPTGGYLVTQTPTLHHRLTSCETAHYLVVLMPPNPWPLPTILVKGIAQNLPDQELQILEIQTFIFLKNITLVWGGLHWIGNSRSCFSM